MTKMEQQTRAAADRASGYFENGFHCAESVVSAVLETLGEKSKEAAAHSTAFGGGIGLTFQEVCGALTGGLIVIGHLHGRREPGGDWDQAALLGAKLRRQFLVDFGSAHCATLRERFGEDNHSTECRKVVCGAAEALIKLLGQDLQEEAPRCDR